MLIEKEEITLTIMLKMQKDFNEELEYPELREKLSKLLNIAYELGKKDNQK